MSGMDALQITPANFIDSKIKSSFNLIEKQFKKKFFFTALGYYVSARVEILPHWTSKFFKFFLLNQTHNKKKIIG